MDTFIRRSQAGFGKLTTALTFLSVFVGLLTILELKLGGVSYIGAAFDNVEPTMRWFDTRMFGAIDGNRKENARFAFDMDVDLTGLFNWNTKQVYAYVTIDYDTMSTSSGLINQNSLVIWDTIIESPDRANLTMKNARSKYSVYDIQSAFGSLNREVSISLRWNIQPRLGFLSYGVTRSKNQMKVVLPRKPRSKTRSAKRVVSQTPPVETSS
ncbi:signal peptidase complex subunit [Starmerella bacillaris]|uniref:Signal peptidase subunit 3 n=1 Tax=Starmerella bacillaris TaxID=1247836 RepID=A0AAV5RCZ2_STABA|nr:signal peptidase complex subunit [Starmerella bacillaris]